MSTFTTYEQVGIKEDIANVISNIDPTKTPFQASLKTEKVKNVLYEWQEDHLDPVGTNAAAEGADAPAASATPTVMRSNRTQILTKAVKVSGTADAVDTYGRNKETGYQLAKASAAIKRDLEFSLVGTGQSSATGNDTSPTARTFGGFQSQIDSGNVFSEGSEGTPAALTEDMVLTANQDLFDVGGDATILMVRPVDALKVAQFAYRQSSGGAVERQVMVNNGTKKSKRQPVAALR